MDSEIPSDGPGDGEEAPYEWLDEWLCEYVDGTMDPSLEAVFEQYVEANPKLKAHIQRLKKTRELLCECSPPPPSSTDDVPPPLPERDSRSSPVSPQSNLRDRPFVVLSMVSSVTAALVIGFLVGATMTEPDRPSASSSPVESTTPGTFGPPAEQQSAHESIPVFLDEGAYPVDSIRSPSSLTTIDLP